MDLLHRKNEKLDRMHPQRGNRSRQELFAFCSKKMQPYTKGIEGCSHSCLGSALLSTGAACGIRMSETRPNQLLDSDCAVRRRA